MICISHRGNVNGTNKELENSTKYIDQALDLGYHCEIDLRMKNDVPHLGHDTPDHSISKEWISDRISSLWIHVKEYGALIWLMDTLPNAIFFCHESDRYTLVSNGIVWMHDMENIATKKCVVPLLSLEQVENCKHMNFYGACSDFVEVLHDKHRSISG
jgi:hypothetical protein